MGHAEGVEINGPSVNEKEQMRLKSEQESTRRNTTCVLYIKVQTEQKESKGNFLGWSPLACNIWIGKWFSDLSMPQNQLEESVKHRLLSPSLDMLV